MSQSILHLITRKRDGFELSADEIAELIVGITAGEVPDYQIGAMLMAIYLRGMSDRETSDLTIAMVHSGEVIDLSAIEGFKADKHSTGGVGDKVTPILGPMVAAAGVYFPKLSGRGLGHTGGTIDKLESIPGFRVDLTIDELIRQVNEIGLAVTGQTGELVPADAVLYGLRDVTGTVASVPLIASSVMSKKIAAGADGIVLDVKCGRGAFMHTEEEAVALSRLMVAIGATAGKPTTAVVTSMQEPLGCAVGNALEIAEAIAVLKGEGAEERSLLATLRAECLFLGSHILLMAGKAPTVEEGERILANELDSGAALEKLRAMIDWQGGDPRVVDDPQRLPCAPDTVELPSPQGGFIRSIDALQVGMVAAELGAGRKTKSEPIDPAVGVVLRTEAGRAVEPGDCLAEIHTNDRVPTHEVIPALLEAFEIGPEPVESRPHILEVITDAAGVLEGAH